MFRKFTDYAKALKAGSEFADAHGVRVRLATLYKADGTAVAFLVGPSSLHLFAGVKFSAEYSCASGWWFGGPLGGAESQAKLKELETAAEREPLPGKGEYWYEVTACNTSGYKHEDTLTIARNVEANNSCVWHEAAALRGAPCHCAKCKPRVPQCR